MKRISLAKRNALLSPSGFSGGAIALAVVAFLVLVRLMVPDLFLSATMPLVQVGNALGAEFHRVSVSFDDTATLALSQEKLSAENQALAIENRTLASQVASLTALLGDTHAQSATPGIVAAVAARPPVSPYDTLVVATGSKGGVSTGMEAFGNGGVPIGVVSLVTDSFARVTLFTAPREQLTAWVGASHVPLTLAGAGAGAFSATAPRAAGIQVGDTVYAPGPGALPIGVVKSIGGDPAAPTVVVHVAPAVNPFTVSEVVLRDVGSALMSALICATSTAP